MSESFRRLYNSPTGLVARAAIGGIGTGFAVVDAGLLYSQRSNMAARYQQTNLIFPRDLIQDNRSFYISFNFQMYEKRSIANSPFLRSQGTVRLPIPSNLKDSLSVTYGQEPLSPTVGATLEGLIGESPVGAEGFGILGTGINRGVGAVTSGAAGAAVDLAQRAASAISPDLPKAGSAYTGLAVNPYQTVLFKNPDFKRHNFSWKFMPRDEVESARIRDIIRTFQHHMSPGVSRGPGIFFSYPSMVVMSLFPSSEYMYRFKPSVIKSVDVNYAAGSAPSFFKRTSAPTAITLSIQFDEIEYWTNNDYDPNNPTQVFNDDAAITSNNARLGG